MEHNELSLEENALAVGVSTFFDEYGRCVPFGVKAAVHGDTRRYFVFSQPKVEYGEIHARITKHLRVADSISVSEFETRAETVLEDLRNDPKTKNITEGVRVPFFLPKAAYQNYGEAIGKNYLEAVRGSFCDLFPEYSFVNHHKSELAGKLSIAPESRHEQLVDAMRQSHVVGYYFPCLMEYSVPAAIEQMKNLPKKFLLAGGFDTSAAFIGSPDLLLRTDGYPPLLWLAALLGEKEGVGYHFEAYGYNLTFNRRAHLGQAAESWASALVVLG